MRLIIINPALLTIYVRSTYSILNSFDKDDLNKMRILSAFCRDNVIV